MNILKHYRPEKVKPYEARWYVNRKVKCRFFATESEREQFIRDFHKELRKNGTHVLDYSPERLRRWKEADSIMGDADPVEVARFWASFRKPPQTKSLSEAMGIYLNALSGLGRDTNYIRATRNVLQKLLAHFGDRELQTFLTEEISDYICNLPFSAVTQKNNRTMLSASFGWFKDQGWLIENPVHGVHTPQVITPEPGILTVEETEKLFRENETADPEICGLLALGAFAGMRSSAIARVEYSELDFEHRGILTPAHKTKKKRRHYIEGLPDNLWEWLKVTPSSAFTMTPRHYAHRRADAFVRAGLLIEQDDLNRDNLKRQKQGLPSLKISAKAPPKNCLRHSFVTYHVALHRDVGKTALLVSHKSSCVLWEHYLGIGKQENAKRYFDIRPSKAKR